MTIFSVECKGAVDHNKAYNLLVHRKLGIIMICWHVIHERIIIFNISTGIYAINANKYQREF